MEACPHEAWQIAMKKELDASECNNTWELTELPKDKEVIGSKRVYKIKYRQDRTDERNKARFVVKGFTQVQREDYRDTFSPIAKLGSVRLLLALAVGKQWFLHQRDVNNIFLHGLLEERVYMLPPQGYTKTNVNQVCCFKKSLCGLKQVSTQLNIEISSFIQSLGFIKLKHDYSLFTYHGTSCCVYMLLYVNDMLLTGSNEAFIQQTKRQLGDKFTIKDLELARFSLGLELCWTDQGVLVNQRKFILDVLQDARLFGAKPIKFSLP